MGDAEQMTKSFRVMCTEWTHEDSEKGNSASKGAFSRLNRPEAINRKGCGTSTQEKAHPPDPMLMISENTLKTMRENAQRETQ